MTNKNKCSIINTKKGVIIIEQDDSLIVAKDELNMINKMIDLFNSNDLTFNFNTKYVRNNDKNTK